MPGLIVNAGRVSATLAVVAASAGCAVGNTQAATGTSTPAAMAHVGKLPGIYLGAMAGPWYGPSVRPASVFLGAGWTISRLRWTAWSWHHARGHGYYSACDGPAGGPPCVKFWGTVTATHVQNHDGHPYFANMKVVGKQHVIRLVMNTRFGWWQEARR